MPKKTHQRHTWRIRVNKQDVLTSIRGDHTAGKCAIANAMKRQFPELMYPRVGYKTIGYSDPATRTRYEFATPPRIARFLAEFDEGRPVTALKLPTLTLNEAKAVSMRPMQQTPPHVTLRRGVEEVRARRTYRRTN